MRAQGSWRIGFVLALSLVAVAAFLAADPAPESEVDRLLALITQLDDDSFAEREAAGEALMATGETALPVLRKAVVDGDDAEVRERARQLIRAIIVAAGKSRSSDIRLMLVDTGKFDMGSLGNESARRPDEFQHPVQISTPFLLDATEVTQAEYEKVMGMNPGWFTSEGEGREKVARQDTDRFPVENVSWFDAIEFCNRLSKLDRYEPYYKLADVKMVYKSNDPKLPGVSINRASVEIVGGNGYRLPTEAEWEFACRAGTATMFHYGNQNSGKEANVKSGTTIGYGVEPSWQSYGRTTKVGSYPGNRWGLHDMHGNVGEWCWDWYDKDYYAKSPRQDPPGPAKGDHRVVRGGSWLVVEGSCRSASRFWQPPGDRNNFTGFRVARTP